MKTWEDFLVFLKKHKVYRKYMRNLKNDDITLQEIQRIHDSLYLASAFTWRKTPEGHEFWLNLHMKWDNA